MKEIRSEKKEVLMGKSLVETGLFLLLLNIVVAVLFWEAIAHHWQIRGDGLLFQRAWIRQAQKMDFTGFSWEKVYLYLLHFLFGFFGNHQSVVIVVNIFLQILGLFLFYRGSRRLINPVVSLVISAGLTILSIDRFSVILDTPVHLVWCFSGSVVWILSFCRPLTERILSWQKGKRENEPKADEDGKSNAAEDEKGNEKKESRGYGHQEGGRTEAVQAVQRIPNPLPIPKRHQKREMTYAFEPPKEKMHYDLNNYSVSDDYDLKGS